MISDSSEQTSGFWTLTRTSKLSKRRNSDLHDTKSNHKSFNICVVGLSGPDKDKGPVGIGKSCFCNRFVRSAADDYQTDHISVLGQSDFNGRVVNKDHWLYWGSVTKSCDGCDLEFNVVEQTEFVDDSCFQPFRSGKIEPYFKRCANLKLMSASAEKLMYVCKNQLGVEKEYDQKYLHDGKFSVDGFLCLFDVSEISGRNIDKQIEITNLILINLVKTKKPVVFVTTKHDEASEMLVAEAERLINQRDFRGIVPIVETSAQENVNVNMAFLVCAQMIDKTRAKFRVPPYFEAHKNQMDLLNIANDAYLRLITSTVVDFKTTWKQVCIKLSHNPEFLQFTYLHGLERATMLFNNHIKMLRDDCISKKVQLYMKIFPDALKIINDDNNNLCSWDTTKEQLKSSPLFDKYFIQMPENINWYDTELLQSNETRIPTDWLDSEEAYSIFHQRSIRKSAKELFIHLLSSVKITVGRPFVEIRPMFANNPNLEVLDDQELFEIYVEYQNNLLQRARANFQELLLENAEHLQPLTSGDKVIRQEDIQIINNILQHDERYQALDMFNQDRTLMMIRHLSFLHSQTSEQCPSYPECVEPELERLLITRAKTVVSKYHESKPSTFASKTCDIIIFGPRRPSQQLILALNVLNSRSPKESQFQITFTVFDNADEVDSQARKFQQSTSKPKGCFGIFTNHRSLELVNYTIEKFLMINSQISGHKNISTSPPIVILYAADITLDERTMLSLENDGQQLADKFKCPFMNVTAIDQYRQHQVNNDHESASQIMSECASLDYACVDGAFNVLKETISRKVCFIELYNNPDLVPHQAFNPDAKLLMCFLCGEPYSGESLLWNTFLSRDDVFVTSSRSLCIRYKTDKFIEIIITSYTHGALNYREDLLHGFILVCSLQRKASISILNAFSYNIPCTPVLIMAINNTDIDTQIGETMVDARSACKRLNGFLEVLDINNQSDHSKNPRKLSKNIDSFLQTVIKKKPSIERAYELTDNDLSTAIPTPAQFGDDEPTTPGKLDLSQFGNITNAIGKLNIHTKTSPNDPQATPRMNTQQLERQQSTTSELLPDSPPQDAGFFKSRGKRSKNRAKDLRQNPGRAVAPPQLPLAETSNNDLNKVTPIQARFGHVSEADNHAIDSNLSPITHRLLKNSNNHKVSELASSPADSDNETTNNETEKEKLGINSLEAKIRNLDKLLSSKPPPGISGIPKHLNTRSSSLDHSDAGKLNSSSASLAHINEKNDNKTDTKKDKKKIRDDEKMEKRRLKEEEKQRKEEKRQEKKLASKKTKASITAETITEEEGVPFFIKRCIEFIESEGLDAEGIYRVPGNRAHVDAFVQKFKENPLMSINECDIPVNAVATALKDFLSKKWGPIIPAPLMDELTDISNEPDKEKRVQIIRNLVNMLPLPNYKLLKYVICHFVKVSHNHSLNSMDSKNLAICWWPTLLPLHFSDMGIFEQMRPHLEESIQTMIDEYEYIFENK